MSNLTAVLTQLAIQGPLFLVWVIGLVLALRILRRHPQVAILSIVAFILLLSQGLLGVLVWYGLVQSQGQLGWPPERLSLAFTILSVARVGVSAAAWVLLLIALFRWRSSPGRLQGYDGQLLPEGFRESLDDQEK